MFSMGAPACFWISLAVKKLSDFLTPTPHPPRPLVTISVLSSHLAHRRRCSQPVTVQTDRYNSVFILIQVRGKKPAPPK